MSTLLRSTDPRKLAMLASLSVSLLMLVGKLTAYFITGSEAILADAIESVIHVFATAFVGFSLWYAVRPPDRNHPYGHGKMAYFSSGIEGVLILVAALAIIYTSVRSLVVGPELAKLGIGLVITGLLTLVNLLLGVSLVRVGRRYNAMVLISNGRHVLTDMWTSLGVLVGVGLVWLTGAVWLDPVVAMLVALNIVWTAVSLLRQAYGGLMERADERETEAIRAALDDVLRRERISSYHQLRHRRINDQVWVEYHLQMPGEWSLETAHDRAHAVEEAVIALFPDDFVTVTAHLEPDEHDDAHPDGYVEPSDPLR